MNNIMHDHHPIVEKGLHKAISLSFWPLLITASIAILTGLGLRDPWPADEPRFALVAKEMVDTGQWFFPARGEELYPDKPPIFMWTIAFFYWITGSIRVAFLLPSGLSGLLTIFLTFDITRRLWNKQTGLVAGWLLLFTFQFTLQAKTAQIDAMVCAWIAIGCYGMLRFLLVDGKYQWYVLAWFFMGIGVITKGVGFLPLLLLIPYWIYRFKTPDVKHIARHKAIYWCLGPVIMLFAISLWVVPMLLVVAQSDNAAFEIYRNNILFKQTVTRYADSWHHLKPFWYYIVSVIPTLWLPVNFTIPWLVKPWIKAFKNLEPRIILPLGWVLLVVLFFSMSPGKRGVYLLPALPMFILCIAPYYSLLTRKRRLKILVFGLSLVISMCAVIFGAAGLTGIDALTLLSEKYTIRPWYFFIVIGSVSLLGILIFWRQNKWLAWPILSLVLWLTYSTYGYHLRNPVSTPISIYDKAQQYLPKNAKIGLVSFSEQFILFSTHPIYHFGFNTPLKNQLEAIYQWQNTDNKFLLIEDKLIDGSCFNKEQGYDLGFAHRRHWLLMPLSAKLGGCKFKSSNLPVYTYKPK